MKRVFLALLLLSPVPVMAADLNVSIVIPDAQLPGVQFAREKYNRETRNPAAKINSDAEYVQFANKKLWEQLAVEKAKIDASRR